MIDRIAYVIVIVAALASIGADVAGASVDPSVINGGGLLAFAWVVYRQGERGLDRLDEITVLLGGTSKRKRTTRKPAARDDQAAEPDAASGD